MVSSRAKTTAFEQDDFVRCIDPLKCHAYASSACANNTNISFDQRIILKFPCIYVHAKNILVVQSIL